MQTLTFLNFLIMNLAQASTKCDSDTGVCEQPVETRPNIVFIMADDLGYADLSVYGNTDFETPHLDKLANDGVRFTQAYANSAVCSATRFALMTGKYQYRLVGGLEEPLSRPGAHLGLPPSELTLPSRLQQAGFDTALFGKWHLGSPPNFSPLKSGYNRFFGNYGGVLDYFTHNAGAGLRATPDLWENDVAVERVGYYTNLIADEAVEYITTKRPKDKPFMVSLHFTAPHWPWEGPEDEAVARSLRSLYHVDGGNLKTYGKMVSESQPGCSRVGSTPTSACAQVQSLDAAVGRVLRALDDSALAHNTIVVFTSDNGGERFSKMWPFSGDVGDDVCVCVCYQYVHACAHNRSEVRAARGRSARADAAALAGRRCARARVRAGCHHNGLGAGECGVV
jgi:arylsulfatase A-like enzyme